MRNFLGSIMMKKLLPSKIRSWAVICLIIATPSLNASVQLLAIKNHNIDRPSDGDEDIYNQFKEIAENNNLCLGKVKQKYVTSQIPKNDVLILHDTSSSHITSLFAFALYKKKKKEINISVLCSPNIKKE